MSASFKQVVSKRRSVRPSCIWGCYHCENLGLPFDHWLRNKEGILVCPVLASTECRYCHALGHTLSNCEKRNQSRNRKSVPAGKSILRAKPNVSVARASNRGAFAFFVSSDSESDSEIKETVLSLIHPDDCPVMEDVIEDRIYEPLRFRCLEKYTDPIRWVDVDSDEDC